MKSVRISEGCLLFGMDITAARGRMIRTVGALCAMAIVCGVMAALDTRAAFAQAPPPTPTPVTLPDEFGGELIDCVTSFGNVPIPEAHSNHQCADNHTHSWWNGADPVITSYERYARPHRHTRPAVSAENIQYQPTQIRPGPEFNINAPVLRDTRVCAEPDATPGVYGSFTEETHAAGYALSGMEIRYDPPPVELSRGALARTTFYGEGELRAVFTISASGEDAPGVSRTLVNYPDPYAFPDSESPGSEEEAAYLFERAMAAATAREIFYDPVPITVETSGAMFALAVDASAYLCPAFPCERIPADVYTINLFAPAGGGPPVAVGSDSVWIGVASP